MAVSHPEWDLHTTATEVARAFSNEIGGKTVVITGVSPISIGANTALAIASQGPARLILASRTALKLGEVAADINQKYPSTPVTTVNLDLSSIDSIKQAAAQIISATDPNHGIDILINNAGISHVARDPIITPDGTKLDKQLFVNHLGPFLLTSLLLPSLQKAAALGGPEKEGSTRVVNLTSHGHRLSAIRFSDYAFEKPVFDESIPESERANAKAPPFLLRLMEDGFPGFVAYGQSKTANVLYATELTRRTRRWTEAKAGGDAGTVLGLPVHPGSIETGLSRSLDQKGQEDMLNTAPKHLWKTPDAGAATTLVAAFDPGLANLAVGVGGVVGYMADCQVRDDLAVAHAKDAAAAKRLWEESERMLGISTRL